MSISTYGILYKALELYNNYELKRIVKKIPGACDLIVQNGPFSGLRFASDVVRSKNLPKIIGTYESELHNYIEELINKQFRLFINVGAAEGYYAIGMALRMPMSNIVAFEMDAAQAERCHRTAILNAVEKRVTVRGKCDSDELAACDLENALIIMDCEGYEIDILQGSLIPKLSKTHLLIELHDSFRPGCSRLLCQRFHQSHKIDFIEAVQRAPDNWVADYKLSMREKRLAIFENRLGIQEWVIMTPKI